QTQVPTADCRRALALSRIGTSPQRAIMSSAPLPAGITCTTPKLNSVTTSRNLEWKPEATANSLSTIDPATGIGVSMVLTPEDVSDTNLHFGSSMVTSNVQPTWRSPDTKMS